MGRGTSGIDPAGKADVTGAYAPAVREVRRVQAASPGLPLFVRAGPCFHCGVFRVPKNGALKTNKPPAMQVSQHCFSLQ